MQRLSFATVFRKVICIGFECKNHVTCMVSDGSIRISCYVVKELVKIVED